LERIFDASLQWIAGRRTAGGRQEGWRAKEGGGGRARPRAAGGQSVNDSLHDVRTKLKISSQELP